MQPSQVYPHHVPSPTSSFVLFPHASRAFFHLSLHLPYIFIPSSSPSLTSPKAKTTMAIKALLLLSLFLLVTSTFANDLSTRREEEHRRLEKCKEECSQLPHYDQGMQRQCVKKCLQQREQSSREFDDEVSRTSPEHRYEQCRQQCQQSKQGQQETKCEHQCKQRFEEERREQGRDSYEEEESSGSSRRELQKKYEKCKQQCSQSRQGEQQRWCKQQCEQEYEKQRRREQEHDDSDSSSRDPQRKLEQCKQDCRESYQGRQQEQRQRQCVYQCQRQFEKEQQRGKEQEFNPGQQEEEEERKQRWQQNPYVFEGESFNLRVRNEHGRIGLLPNFAKRSNLLLGIANNRVALLEANPNTFVVPNHFDADAVFYVVEGEGVITMAGDRKVRESHNIKRGEVIKVPAGVVVYIVNRSNNQKLRIAKLLKPISTPGQVEGFYTVGGEEPESYYRVFSTEILEAALNTRRDQLQRLFGRQKQGVIIKISEEQVRSLSQSSSEQGSHWPFGGGESSKRTYDLLNKRPTYSNKHGKFYEVDCNDFEELKDLNLQVTFANITRGSMMVPFYNSEATKIAIVTNGRGYFEMVCPHLSQEHEQQQRKQKKLQKVRSQLSRNTVFIVPAGHPVAVLASKEENLEVVCFEVNARNNMRTFVAGKNNIVSLLEREAKELAFGVSSKIVDEVFNNEGQEEMFTRGPEKSLEREERQQQSEPLQSILDFTSF